MKIIYQVKHNHDYQFLFPVDTDTASITIMDCEPRIENWTPPRFYNHIPTLKRTDFYNYDSGYLITTDEVIETLGKNYLEDRCEILPIICDEPYCPEQPLFIINIWFCVNCLDDEKTVWQRKKLRIVEKPAFNPSRLPASGLFKIPEKRATAMYILVDTEYSDMHNLKHRIEENQFRGLSFDIIWQGDDTLTD